MNCYCFSDVNCIVVHSLILLAYLFHLLCHSCFAMFDFDLFYIQMSVERCWFVKCLMRINVRTYVYMYVCIMYVCICVCMYLCKFVCMYLRMCVCKMYVYIYVCIYAMHMYICTYACIYYSITKYSTVVSVTCHRTFILYVNKHASFEDVSI
jgi:hypothetical protein